MNDAGVLCFPFIVFPDVNWIARQLLVWDSVSIIAPPRLYNAGTAAREGARTGPWKGQWFWRERADRPETVLQNRRYRQQVRYMEEGLVLPLDPVVRDGVAFTNAVQAYFDALYVDRRPLRSKKQQPEGRAMVHLSKTGEAGLAEYFLAKEWAQPKGDWIELPLRVACDYMSLLAAAMAGEAGTLVPATPLALASERLLESPQAVTLSRLATRPDARVGRIMTDTIRLPKAPSAAAVVEFRKKYADERARFREYVLCRLQQREAPADYAQAHEQEAEEIREVGREIALFEQIVAAHFTDICATAMFSINNPVEGIAQTAAQAMVPAPVMDVAQPALLVKSVIELVMTGRKMKADLDARVRPLMKLPVAYGSITAKSWIHGIARWRH